MTSIPLKPQYGPTLGSCSSRAGARRLPTVRALAIAAGVGSAGADGRARAEPARRLLFARWRGAFQLRIQGPLSRQPQNPGGYVKVARSSGGKLEDSYAVAPLAIGSIAAASPASCRWPPLPTHARWQPASPPSGWKARARRASARRWPAIKCSTARLSTGTRLYGRDVILIPPHHGASEGVVHRDAQQRTGNDLKAGGKLGRARNAVEDVRVRLAVVPRDVPNVRV